MEVEYEDGERLADLKQRGAPRDAPQGAWCGSAPSLLPVSHHRGGGQGVGEATITTRLNRGTGRCGGSVKKCGTNRMDGLDSDDGRWMTHQKLNVELTGSDSKWK